MAAARDQAVSIVFDHHRIQEHQGGVFEVRRTPGQVTGISQDANYLRAWAFHSRLPRASDARWNRARVVSKVSIFAFSYVNVTVLILYVLGVYPPPLNSCMMADRASVNLQKP